MTAYFSVCLEKEDLVFSAAHFITFGENICERLHGHNYRVRVRVSGPLQSHGYVVDFIALHKVLKRLVTDLDHHVLLPTKHPTIQVHVQGAEVLVRFEERRWVFPTDDCVLLDIPNTTAEHLAEYLAGKLLLLQTEYQGATIQQILVEVDENHGQWGGYSCDAWRRNILNNKEEKHQRRKKNRK